MKTLIMNAVAPIAKKRIDSIDIVRGIVMIIMALDHTRDFFTDSSADPTDLTRVSTALFLTRFITHYCAATFVFLAGTGAFLSISRGKTKWEACKFLVSRGLWLIILELTIIHWGWGFGYFLQVIWAIGVSMIVLGVMVFLPVSVITALGLIMIFGHDLFDRLKPTDFTGAESTLWSFLHVQGVVKLFGEDVFILYPLIPWVGVMMAGYGFGKLYTIDAPTRKKYLRLIGCSAILLFVLIRSFNFYGDPSLWTEQGSVIRTVLSFINVSKYPPSLDYLLITLGPVILLLSFLEDVQNSLTNVAVLFGRVALFYYILHLYLIHGLAILIAAISGSTKGLSFSLPVVYLLWALVIFILYFPCRWFMQYKRTHNQWWLSYF
ncbi:DUF1624 domain-containing protein [Mucilaginibacter auburnensis]|uniref:DUF1624 domain-containing protein n=1 Tax=Mucilaginibacter auburnensis TaxID=1457233 RepID=UPI001B802CA4|nr:heparan-alpha-glucosaminide N-acetyltransferase domain-containing protein [Mucilaginibacter auburnensis]